ncbi:MAG: TolC family protein, partial [Spirochaetales bacterium]|nr:TolC family protein [Spirochaetales bacterium]MCF7939096.1 TolC family protein [Spirochaetales bacterium]
MARIPVQHLYRLLGLFLFVSAGLVFGDPVFAGENDSGYTLDRCIDLAVENNLGLKKEMLDMKTAGEADENLWSLFLPSINLQGGVNYSKTLFTESTMPGQEPFSYSAGASLSLQLNTGIAAEIRKTSAAYHLAEISYEAARSNIISTVSTEFFRLLLAEREIELLQEDLELAGRQSEMNTIRFENGRINERTLLQSKLNVETAKLSLSKKRSAYRLDKRSFLNILGLKEEIQLLGKIEVQLVDFDTQAVIDQYLAKRTDIR